jgi:hypothetical protein
MATKKYTLQTHTYYKWNELEEFARYIGSLRFYSKIWDYLVSMYSISNGCLLVLDTQFLVDETNDKYIKRYFRYLKDNVEQYLTTYFEW